MQHLKGILQEDGRLVYAAKGLKQYYIQVCADILNTETRIRDENGFTIIGITDPLI